MHSVCLSICARSNSRKLSSDALKLIYIIHIWHSMNYIDNGIGTTNDLSTETVKIFWYITGEKWGEKYLKRILTYLHSTKYNEINMCHSHIQKHVSYKKWSKKYKYYAYRLTQMFSDTLHPTVENFLKLYLTYLYSTKYNEINVGHLDVQNHFFYKKKRYK